MEGGCTLIALFPCGLCQWVVRSRGADNTAGSDYEYRVVVDNNKVDTVVVDRRAARGGRSSRR